MEEILTKMNEKSYYNTQCRKWQRN